MRHIKVKHSNCNNLGLIFENKNIVKTMETLQTNMDLQTDNSEGIEAVSGPSTPVASEIQQNPKTYNIQWTPFRPLDNISSVNVSQSSIASTCLYSDLEEYVNQNSTGSDVETLPTPEPVKKKMKMAISGSGVDSSNPDLTYIKETLSALERNMEARFVKIENQLSILQSSLGDQITQTSSQAQHYNRSLAGVLQKDIGSLKELVKGRNSGSEQFLNSVVEFNKGVLRAIQGDNVGK